MEGTASEEKVESVESEKLEESKEWKELEELKKLNQGIEEPEIIDDTENLVETEKPQGEKGETREGEGSEKSEKSEVSETNDKKESEINESNAATVETGETGETDAEIEASLSALSTNSTEFDLPTAEPDSPESSTVSTVSTVSPTSSLRAKPRSKSAAAKPKSRAAKRKAAKTARHGRLSRGKLSSPANGAETVETGEADLAGSGWGVSSLGFNFSAFYEDRSTAPRRCETPATRWNSGSSMLQRFVNREFLPRQRETGKPGSRPIVFVARGDARLAQQMLGICDALLLALLYGRPCQCKIPAGVMNSPRPRGSAPPLRVSPV